jgi:hypothetical protein
MILQSTGNFSFHYYVSICLRLKLLMIISIISSKKSNNVNIILRFSDPILGVMDPAFVLSKVIVKAPTHGFTAPCMFQF